MKVSSEVYLWEALKQAQYYSYCKEAERALLVLKPVWSNLEESPQIDGLSDELACELLIVCGNVLSHYGMAQQKKNYQERAEDLLTEARDRALGINRVELVARAEKETAVAFWRKGEYENAIAFTNTVFSHFSEAERLTNKICLLAKANLIILYTRTGEYGTAHDIIREIQPLVEAHADLWLKTTFYNQAGAFFILAGKFKEAIPLLEKAVEFSAAARNNSYLGNALNNLAQAYINLEDFKRAHYFINESLNLFARIDSPFSYAVVLETKVQILIKEKKLSEAFSVINESLAILSKGENYPDYCQSLWTKIIVLVKSGERRPAQYQFIELMDVVRTHLSRAIADAYLDKYDKLLHLPTGNDFYEKIENFRRELLGEALERSGGLVKATAKYLGISHQNTSKMLQKFPDLVERYGVKLRTRRPNLLFGQNKSKKSIAVQINSNRLEYLGLPAHSVLNVALTTLDKLDLSKPVAVKDASGEFDCGFLLRDFGMFAFGDGRGEIERCYMKEEVVECGQIVAVFDEQTGGFLSVEF